VKTQIKDAGIVIIVFLAASVDAGGKAMSCDCICHDPTRSRGMRCILCDIHKNGCNIHGACKSPENICQMHPRVKITDCYRCHLEKEHR